MTPSRRIWIIRSKPHTPSEDRYWLGLAASIEAANAITIFALDPTDSLWQAIPQLGFRIINWRELSPKIPRTDCDAILFDTLSDLATLQKIFPTVTTQHIRQVSLSDNEWQLSLRRSNKLFASPEKVTSPQHDWLPLVTQTILVSPERADQWLQHFNSTHETPHLILEFGTLPSHSRNLCDTIVKLWCEDGGVMISRPPIAKELQSALPNIANKIVAVSTDQELEAAWSVAQAYWHFGTLDSLATGVIEAASIGLPVFLDDRSEHCEWVAAGMANEAISLNQPQRWLEATLAQPSATNWESRRERIRNYHSRWNAANCGAKLLSILGWQPETT